MELESGNIMSNIPRELWLTILKNLSQKELLNVSLVSKEFYSLAMDPVLWRSVELKLGQHRMLGLQLNLLERCTGLHDLKLIPCNLMGLADWSRMLDLSWTSILVACCKNLKMLKIINCPYIRQEHVRMLINSLKCRVEQTTIYKLNQETKLLHGIVNTANYCGNNPVDFHQVRTTDYYRKGNPYKILRVPGESAIILRFQLVLKKLFSVTISLNHCRTTADGVVNMTVNGRPAEKTNDGEFVKKVIMAPRFDLGWESFPLCLDLLNDGDNTVTICLDYGSPGVYWLSDAVTETINDWQ